MINSIIPAQYCSSDRKPSGTLGVWKQGAGVPVFFDPK